MRMPTTTIPTRWLLAMLLLAMPALARSQDVAAPAGSAAALSVADQELNAGLAAYLRRHFSEAERHFRAAVDADPRNAAAHFYLAYSIYKIAEPRRPNDPGKQRAAEEFAKAYELDPLFVPGWGRRKP
jgi:tetratricopeptide (TPR) repeat protein